jgi:hypothetical protein
MKDELNKIAAAMREYAAMVEAMAVEPENPQTPKPPPGYRMATEDERRCLPEGAKHCWSNSGDWVRSGNVGKSGATGAFYAVPDTFEAHGKTWKRHTPGDPVPCDGDAIVEWLTEQEENGTIPYVPNHVSKASLLGWNAIRGWRYDDEEKPKFSEPWAKEKEALKQGNLIQYTDDNNYNSQWIDCPVPQWVKEGPGKVNPRYRIKPEPKMIPLGPEDVLPGSAFRMKLFKEGIWVMPCATSSNGISYSNPDLKSEEIDWAELFHEWQINRSIPLTGKWDANAWEPCEKEAAE